MRPEIDEYFMEMARLVSKRSTCMRRNVGAVIVKEKRVLATGYNGTPKGLKHCAEVGCVREQLKVPETQRHELCLPSGEEVLTDEGYIPINKVRLGQKVLTHKNAYRKVIQLFKREYKGVLYHIEPWYLLPVALTPNHPVLVTKTKKCQFDARTLCKETCQSVNNAYCDKPYLNYKLEWVEAREVSEKDMLPLLFDNKILPLKELDFSFVVDAPLNYYRVVKERHKGRSYGEIKSKLNIWPSTAYNWARGSAPRDCIVVYKEGLRHGSSASKIIPNKIKLAREAFRLIGFYLAEGCSSANQVSFSFNKKEEEFIEEVKTTMKKLFDLDCYEYRKRNVHKLVYSSIVLAKVFKALFGGNAYTKRLPHSMIKLHPKEQIHILSSYAQGDGYKIDQNTTTITTASKELAMQVMQILLRCGYLPIIDSSRNTYRLIWKDKFKISYGYLKDNIFFTPIRKIWREEYSGYVYNLEVEGDNSYITKSFIVHNCRGLHAEQNAIIQAALFGVSIKDSSLYTTHFPCSVCAKMLINADIKEIIYGEDYADELAKKLLNESGIKVRKYKK